ncbi:DNZ54_00345 family protein [Yersinia proxima]|uniref:DNZ54_00345 family protein n=1 Tax=Yersinia proxima TaxID=2890316 RepID=UPI001D0F910C|nr:DNZ54_00345 family protein [Yersinia proxima]
MKSLIYQAISLVLLATLIFSVLTERESITAIVVSAYWIVIFLAAFVSVAVMLVTALVTIETNAEKKEKLIELLKKAAVKRGIIRRSWNWLCLVLIAGALAYGGWVFTAVVYVITSLICRLCGSIVRDKMDELELAK